jgi:hypothetical protein
MPEVVVYKLVMGLTPEDVVTAIKAGCRKEMGNLIDSLAWLAFRWWTSPGEKNSKTLKEVQDRIAALQLTLNPR